MDVSIISIGFNKGAKRVWLQGNMLSRAGFVPHARFDTVKEGNAIVLQVRDVAKRGVSVKRRKEQEIPVIDINNSELLDMYEGLDTVRVIYQDRKIYILPLASELRKRERIERAKQLMISGQPLAVGSLAHGIGVMDDAVAEGFRQAGIKTKLKFANEIRFDLIDHCMSLNRTFDNETIALHGKMQELAYDEYVMQKVGRVDLITAGIPCSAASVAGRAKCKTSRPEQHEQVGHLVASIVAMLSRFNPLAFLGENVVPYSNSASMDILRTVFDDFGYDLYESTANGADWNALEHRERFVFVAMTKGVSFFPNDLEMPEKISRTLGEILENIPLDDERWRPMQGLKDKEIRDAAAGKSFAMQIFDADDQKICTLTKGLAKVRSTDAKIQHPVNPDLLRVPTSNEHAAAKGIPHEMLGDLSETIRHEGLGQSVIYQKMVSYGKLIAKSFRSLIPDEMSGEFKQAA